MLRRLCALGIHGYSRDPVGLVESANSWAGGLAKAFQTSNSCLFVLNKIDVYLKKKKKKLKIEFP